MTWQATAWALKQRTGSPSAKVVILVLANYANEFGICWPSQKTLAFGTEQSEDSVQRRLRDLEKLGLIRKRKRKRKDGMWPITEYELLMAEDQINQAANCGTADPSLPQTDQAGPQEQRTPSRTAVRQELSLNPTLEYSFGGHQAGGHPFAVRLANAVEKQLGTDVFKSWFKGVCLHEACDGTVTISVPKKFHTNYIRNNFSEVILNCARTLSSDMTLLELNAITYRAY
jgi:hypothetical protein